MNASDSHVLTTEEVLRRLGVSEHGLSRAEAAARLARFGPNTLPHDEPPGVFRIFTRQFLSPLIYILLLAAVVSMILREWSDAGFIFGVLLFFKYIPMIAISEVKAVNKHQLKKK